MAVVKTSVETLGQVPVLLRKSLLAWIGALVMVQDECGQWVETLVERGELAEREGREAAQSALTGLKARWARPAVPAVAKAKREPSAALGLRARLADFWLKGLGRPTNLETEELTRRIEVLEAKIAALSS